MASLGKMLPGQTCGEATTHEGDKNCIFSVAGTSCAPSPHACTAAASRTALL